MSKGTLAEIEELRAIIQNDELPIQKRQTAAEHLVQIVAEAAEKAIVKDDDPEVIELQKPREDAGLAQLFKYAPPTLQQAKADIAKRRRLRAVLAIVVNETASTIERLAACAWILGQYPEISKWGLNQYTPERLLAEALPADGVKWTSCSLWDGPVQVSRPPQSLQDVWAL